MGGAIRKPATNDKIRIHRSEDTVIEKDTDGNLVVRQPEDHLTGAKLTPKAVEGYPIRVINLSKGNRTQLVYKPAETGAGGAAAEDWAIDGTKGIVFKVDGETSGVEQPELGDHIRLFWVEEVTGDSNDASSAIEVVISPETFPGTYKIVGETFIRSEKTGKDEAFQFIIGKAKVSSNVTITLEAEGDPSTFEMTINVLRSTNDRGENEMMKLLRYGAASDSASTSHNDYGSLD